jgi:hypothetical protein
MFRYYFSWLLLCVGLLYEFGLYSTQETAAVPVAQKGCEIVPRRRSPLGVQGSLLYEEDEVLQDIRYLFQPAQQAQKILTQVSSCAPIVLRHKLHGYRISIHLGHIAQYYGTAVINTYTPSRQMPAACLELYQTAGSSFVSELRKLYISNPMLFNALEKCPGNSCVIPTVGNLAFDMMVLMYMPQVVKQKQRPQVVSLICEGLINVLSKQLYDVFQRYDIKNVRVVLPALGHDVFFEGYDRSEMAQNMVYTVVRTLRFLYGMKRSRLQEVSFVVNTLEAYHYYADALKSVRDSEKEYFDSVEE